MYQKAASVVKTTAPVAIAAGLMGGVAFASDDSMHPAHYPWPHLGYLSTYDAKGLRRGFEVYTNVCKTCHSMNLVCFRNLVGHIYSEADAKKLARSVTFEDIPGDDESERPGKLTDPFPAPYKSEDEAREINNGALPPDLSLISKARHGGSDYLFALLTGYREAPAGVVADESAGQYYNPYFAGAKIGMPVQLVDEGVEYSDGTYAFASQQAKDVCEFLNWAAEPEADERKRFGLKWMSFMIAMCALAGYYKRFRWMPLKTRKISYV